MSATYREFAGAAPQQRTASQIDGDPGIGVDDHSLVRDSAEGLAHSVEPRSTLCSNAKHRIVEDRVKIQTC